MRVTVASYFLAAVMVGCGASAPEPKVAAPPAGDFNGDVTELMPFTGQRIVNYNVENLFDTEPDPKINDQDFTPSGKLNWTKDRYNRKLEHLAAAISWSGPELPVLIGLEEVENRAVVQDLANTAPLKGYTILHHDSQDERGIDVALLVRDAFAEVISEEALNIPLVDDRTRDVLYAQLRIADGEELHVFVDHWSSRHGGQEQSEPKRMIAARVVRTKVDAILAKDPEAKILVMGDFNDHPTDRSIQEGLKAACDPKAKADLFDLMCIDTPSNHGSYNYEGEWGYLDQMIVSRGLLPIVKDAKALWDERLLFKHPKYGKSPDKTYSGGDYKGGYSDHLPVVLELK